VDTTSSRAFVVPATGAIALSNSNRNRFASFRTSPNRRSAISACRRAARAW
jgi:hypothetical protein